MMSVKAIKCLLLHLNLFNSLTSQLFRMPFLVILTTSVCHGDKCLNIYKYFSKVSKQTISTEMVWKFGNRSCVSRTCLYQLFLGCF